MLRPSLTLVALMLAVVPCSAQPTATPRAPESAIRRWLDLQQLTLYTRYRFIETNQDIVNSNDQQMKESVRFRVNVDAGKRFSINVASASGTSFISAWDNTGWGPAKRALHHYVKQLYASASPASGLEFQGGGLFVVRGESTEYTSYDEDGYLLGERVSVRRPKQLYVDEISVTRAALTSTTKPNLFNRLDDFNDQHYTHVLATKRFSQMVAGSGDVTRQLGANTLRGAVSFRFKPAAPIAMLRLEGYYRAKASAAGGFAATAERPITTWVRLAGGYATVDEHYGNLNSDRIQRGRRVFALSNISIRGPLSGVVFISQALRAPYTISNRTRFDAILQYDALAALRKTGRI